EALRSFLADQGSKRVTKQDLWRLVGGTLRLRLTARAVAELPGDADAVQSSRDALEHRTITLESWYERLADPLGKPHQPRPPPPRPPGGPRRALGRATSSAEAMTPTTGSGCASTSTTSPNTSVISCSPPRGSLSSGVRRGGADARSMAGGQRR